MDYSKRKKQRYFLLEFIPTSTYFDSDSLAKKINNNELDKMFIPINPDAFLRQLQAMIEEWFGLYGLAHSLFSRFYYKFIYFNGKTGLAVLACPHKLMPMMSTILSMMRVSSNDNKEIYIVRTLFTSGSIKKCKRGAVQYQMKWIQEKAILVSDIEMLDPTNVTLLSFNDDDVAEQEQGETSSRGSFSNFASGDGDDEDFSDRFVSLTTSDAITKFVKLYIEKK